MKTKLKLRVIPQIQVNNFQVVKSKKFEDYRIIGNLEQNISVYNYRKVDEIVITDIGASKIGFFNPKILKLLSKNSLMPITYGGGIDSINKIQECLLSGCDKVILNTVLFKNPDFIKEAVNYFGSQCIVASIDFKKIKNEYFIYCHQSNQIINDTKNTLSLISKYNVGEYLITSYDFDGTMKGYDLNILNYLKNIISFNAPVIINGGCGTPEDMHKAFSNGADACCASSIFNFTKYSYHDVKKYLLENKLDVRI